MVPRAAAFKLYLIQGLILYPHPHRVRHRTSVITAQPQDRHRFSIPDAMEPGICHLENVRP
jgi:hypothetical protein